MPIRNNIVYGPPEVSVPAHLNFGQYCYDQLKKGGDKIAQVCADTGRTTTYRQVLQRSVNLAAALRRLGLRRGDVVALSSENRFEFTVTSLAVMYAGGTLATLNITYTPEELNHTLSLCKPRYIFCSPISAKRMHAVSKAFPSVDKLIIYGSEQLVSGEMYENLISVHEDVEGFVLEDVKGTEDTLAIMASSGTTGLPKGVMLTHLNFLVLAMHYRYYLEQSSGGRECRSAMSLIPWFHAYGLLTHLNLLAMHVQLVYVVRFEEAKYLQALQDYKVNLTLIVPPIAVFFAKHPLVEKFDLSALHNVWCGAAPLSKDVQAAASSRIGIDFIRQGYGFTEMTMANMVDLSDGSKTGSCGQPGPGLRVKVSDLESGKPLGPFEEGELCFKGPLAMKGYVGDRASTEQQYDSDGYVRSGDVGYYDNDGYFYVIDRLKELIKYKGFQVAPAELEAILLKHAAVREAGVVGAPDEAAGELPLAFVALQPGASVTQEQLVEFVADKVSPAKHLRGGVIFVPEIPKNQSGKILRRELRQMLKKLQSKL